MKHGEFVIRRLTLKDHGFSYSTFQVVGYLNGERIRRKFKTREEAIGEKTRLEVAAANGAGGIRAVNTRLTIEQVADAEAAFQALGARPLREAVSWFLTHYRQPVTETTLETAKVAFLAARKPHVRSLAYRDYRNTLRHFCAAFPGRSVDSIATPDVERFSPAFDRH